jgi:AraC family transcriptional regulator
MRHSEPIPFITGERQCSRSDRSVFDHLLVGVNTNMKSAKKEEQLMIDAPEGGDKPSFTVNGINAFVRGPSTRLLSSRRLGWGGVCLEQHVAAPVEQEESTSTHHLIVLLTNHVSRGESSLAQRRFAPYSYSPGAIHLLPAGPIGACRPSTDTTMMLCALDPKFVDGVESGLETPSIADFRRIMNLRDRSLESIIMLLAAEAQSGGFSGKLYADHLAHALAVRFLLLARGAQGASSVQPKSSPHRALRRVLEKMEAEVASDLDLSTLAAEIGYSKSHFLRMFRAGMRCSPHQWLMQLRVERVKKMLRESSDSLIDIAAASGFSSHSHLSRTFRQFVGVTPNQYRRNRSLLA